MSVNFRSVVIAFIEICFVLINCIRNKYNSVFLFRFFRITRRVFLSQKICHCQLYFYRSNFIPILFRNFNKFVLKLTLLKIKIHPLRYNLHNFPLISKLSPSLTTAFFPTQSDHCFTAAVISNNYFRNWRTRSESQVLNSRCGLLRIV